MLWTTRVGLPRSASTASKSALNRVRISGVAAVVGDVVLGGEFHERGLIGSPRGDGDAHAVAAEEARAACADAWTAADDQGDVLARFG